MLTFFVGLGGFMGTIARYLVYVGFREQLGFPWATLTVNVVGCFLIGCAFFWNQNQPSPHPYLLILTTGFLGGFTTFSAFGLETFQLFESQQYLLASANVIANVCLGLAALAIARLCF